MPSITDEGFDIPLAKRQKVTPSSEPAKQQFGSRIFSPFRTLGLVSPTSVPFTSVRLGKSTFQITTSVGKCLQTYDLKKGLNLIFSSRPQTPEPITATFAWKENVLAAWGGLQPGGFAGLWVFRRGKKVAALEAPRSLPGPILQILVFGTWIVGCCERSIEVWKTTSYEHYTTLTPTNSTGPTEIPVYTGQICNMPTYVNKVFAGRHDGTVEIWNLSTGKLLYSILPRISSDGAVTSLQPTPALSLIAIAYKSGALVIQDVDSDQPSFTVTASSSQVSPITSIAFRNDGQGAGDDGKQAGIMATATVNSGDVTIWDLNRGGRKIGVLRGAHEMSSENSDSGVNRIEFLDGQPVLVSSGRDNALRTWIFDEVAISPIPRPLHGRSGHSAAVSALKFLPASSDGSDSMGKWLLSASRDHSLWGFSLRRDGQNAELSQGNITTKLKSKGRSHLGGDQSRSEDFKAPEITAIACSLNRDAGMNSGASQPIWGNHRDFKGSASNTTGWESIVTGHRGDKYARTWYWGKKKAGRWAFETGDGTEVKSVAISACGTFALVGSAGGCIDMFNLQSGLHRQRFPPTNSSKPKGVMLYSESDHLAAENGILGQHIHRDRHTKAVTGLAVDGLNRSIISCGLDGKLKFWDFNSGSLLTELNWSPMAAITGLRYNSISDLVALSCDDLSIRIIDGETKKIIREFWGCRGQINDFSFSNDGRWIISTSMDSIIRVWDLATGHLIDAFQLSSTCTALAFSGTGEFLATAHADGVGINIWNNKSLFLNLPPKHIDENEITNIGKQTESGDVTSGVIDAAFTSSVEDGDDSRATISSEQLDQDMMTLSIVPRSTWQTLLHLDAIKERNKPKEPPKAPEKAPFFLPSLLEKSQATTPENVDLRTVSSHGPAPEHPPRLTKLQQNKSLIQQTSHLSSLLSSGSCRRNFEPFIDYLKSLSPGKIDLEIRSLDFRVRDGHCEIVDFVTALSDRLRSKKDFELINAWMAVFLRVHGDIIGQMWESARDDNSLQLLQTALTTWKVEQQREAKRLSELIGYCRGITGFLRSAR